MKKHILTVAVLSLFAAAVVALPVSAQAQDMTSTNAPAKPAGRIAKLSAMIPATAAAKPSKPSRKLNAFTQAATNTHVAIKLIAPEPASGRRHPALQRRVAAAN